MINDCGLNVPCLCRQAGPLAGAGGGFNKKITTTQIVKTLGELNKVLTLAMTF